MSYYNKYIKYKNKYLSLKKLYQIGGTSGNTQVENTSGNNTSDKNDNTNNNDNNECANKLTDYQKHKEIYDQMGYNGPAECANKSS